MGIKLLFNRYLLLSFCYLILKIKLYSPNSQQTLLYYKEPSIIQKKPQQSRDPSEEALSDSGNKKLPLNRKKGALVPLNIATDSCLLSSCACLSTKNVMDVCNGFIYFIYIFAVFPNVPKGNKIH